MLLRHAELSDIPILAVIQCRAFSNDRLFAHMYPFRHRYPEDYYAAFLHELTLAFMTPGYMMTVAVIEEKDLDVDAKEGFLGSKIVGFNTCIRHGTPKKAGRWMTDSTEKAFQRDLLEIEQKTQPNRAISTETLNGYAEEALRIYGQGENWINSVMLAVLPEYQHLGISKHLISRVTAAAWDEGLDVYFEATDASEKIYFRMGAQVIGKIKRAPKRYADQVELPELTVLVMRLPLETFRPKLQRSKL